MYNLVRNTTLTGLSVYVGTMFIPSMTTAVISGVVFSFVAILFETLSRISKHQKQYTEMIESTNSRNLSNFRDDGHHLPSLYTYLESVSAKLIERKKYLGDNQNVFERPYRFIKDTKYIVERVIKELPYLNEIPESKFKSSERYLFVNERFDSNQKERYEFYIANMNVGTKRDELIQIYRKKYPRSTLEIKTSSEVKYLTERAERLQNIPDHLNTEFDFIAETNKKIKD